MLGPDPSIACRHIRAIGSEYHACSSRSSGQARGWRSHESIFQPAGIKPLAGERAGAASAAFGEWAAPEAASCDAGADWSHQTRHSQIAVFVTFFV